MTVRKICNESPSDSWWVLFSCHCIMDQIQSHRYPQDKVKNCFKNELLPLTKKKSFNEEYYIVTRRNLFDSFGYNFKHLFHQKKCCKKEHE